MNEIAQTDANFSRRQCRICTDLASGCHFGVLACEGCKGFFRRSIQKNAKFVCYYTNSCDVYGIKKRKCCQKCRMDACIVAGMNSAMIKKNNPTKKRKYETQSLPDTTSLTPMKANPIPKFNLVPWAVSMSPQNIAMYTNLVPFDPTANFDKTRWKSDVLPKTVKISSSDQCHDSGVSITNEDRKSFVSTSSVSEQPSSRRSVIRKFDERGKITVVDPPSAISLISEPVPRHHQILESSSCHKRRISDLPLRKQISLQYSRSMTGSLNSDVRRLTVQSPKHTMTTTTGQGVDTCDPMTRLIFSNLDVKIKEAREICQTSSYFNQLCEEDQNILFQHAAYELIILNVFFMCKETIRECAVTSRTIMQSLLDGLERCNLKTTGELTLVMMLSVLSYDRLQRQDILRDFELVKSLRKIMVDQIKETIGSKQVDNIPCYVNVLLLMPKLRELNEYWRSCKFNQGGFPIEMEKIQEKPNF